MLFSKQFDVFYQTCELRKKKEILSKEFDHLALVGFGPIATAVKINIKDMFRTSPKKPQPSFDEIMTCSLIADIMNLTPSNIMDESKLTSHAVSLPFLTEILIKEDFFQHQKSYSFSSSISGNSVKMRRSTVRRSSQIWNTTHMDLQTKSHLQNSRIQKWEKKNFFTFV